MQLLVIVELLVK